MCIGTIRIYHGGIKSGRRRIYSKWYFLSLLEEYDPRSTNERTVNGSWIYYSRESIDVGSKFALMVQGLEQITVYYASYLIKLMWHEMCFKSMLQYIFKDNIIFKDAEWITEKKIILQIYSPSDSPSDLWFVFTFSKSLLQLLKIIANRSETKIKLNNLRSNDAPNILQNYSIL